MIDNYFSYPMYKDLRDQNQVFTGILAADKAQIGVSWHNQAESADAEVVSGNYFQLLGLKPSVGRLFTPQDDTAKGCKFCGGAELQLLENALSAVRADVVGQTVLINGHPFTILGVAPINFDSAIGGYKPGDFRSRQHGLQSPCRGRRSGRPEQSQICVADIGGEAQAGRDCANRRRQASAPLWHSLRANELATFKKHV